MKLLDVLNSPWAIEPPKLLEIQNIYATHLRGDRIDIADVEARIGKPLVNEPKSYDVVDGVAVLPLGGVLAKRMNLFMQISGGTSTQLAARNLRQALADPEVHSIILSVDSPGGTVDGTQALADLVLAARGVKPVVTLADGAMASAAYWIGSAADRVYIADGTTMVGSIGVVETHMDVSKSEEMMGVKTTEITAGKYKRIASEHAPLTDEGRQTIQDQVDYTYSVFVGAVARHRGVSEDKVLKDMADGRVFIGEQAVAAGLVDGVSTLEALIEQLNTSRAGAAQPPKSSATSQGAAMPLTREQLAAENPELLQAVLAEGAAAERERIQAVEGQLIPGHESLINTLKFDGKSTAGDAALAVTAAERAQRAAHAQAQAGEAPAPVALVPRATVEPDTAAAEAALDALPLEERCKAKWEANTDNVRAEFTSLAAFVAFEKANTAGQVKVLRK